MTIDSVPSASLPSDAPYAEWGRWILDDRAERPIAPGFTITPEREFAKDVKPFEFKKSGAESVDPHHKNLQNAIRKNEPLKCPAELGYRGMVVCKMAVESFRKRQYVKWDAAKEQIKKA